MIGVSLAFSVTLAACGGGTPSKADFTERLRDGIATDLNDALKAQGVDQAIVSDAIDTYIDCQYESIKDQHTLLEAVYDDPTAATVSAQLETLTEPCASAFQAELSKHVTVVPTTTPATSIPVTVPSTTTG